MTVPRSLGTLVSCAGRATPSTSRTTAASRPAAGRCRCQPGRHGGEEVDAGEAHGVLLALALADDVGDGEQDRDDQEHQPPRVEEFHPATPAVMAARWAERCWFWLRTNVLMSATQSRSVANTRWLAPAARTAAAMASWRALAASA